MIGDRQYENTNLISWTYQLRAGGGVIVCRTQHMISKRITNDRFFWNVSNEILVRIEGASYVSNKEKHNDYLWFHPYVAKKRFINLYSTGKFD